MIVVFMNNLKIIILSNSFLIIVIGILVYYYGFKTIYKVQQERSRLVFFACLKKYVITEKPEIKKELKGYYIGEGISTIWLPRYIGIPIERNKCWTDSDIAEIKQFMENK